MESPSKVLVWDNEGETIDRYTIVTPDGGIFGMSSGGRCAAFDQFCGELTDLGYEDLENFDHCGKKLDIIPDEVFEGMLARGYSKEELGYEQ